MDKFEIGETAEIRGIVNAPEYNGMDCEIVGDLRERLVRSENYKPVEPVYVLTYIVETEAGEVTFMHPMFLRKKKPPQELGSWEEVQKHTNWNPNGQKETNLVTE